MQKVIINNREYTVIERDTTGIENIVKANPDIVAMVLLEGKRGATKYGYEHKSGYIDVIGSL
jgi:hypothetical protein